MRKPQFSLKTLVFVITLAAVLLGWWADHRNSARAKRELGRLYQSEIGKLVEGHRAMATRHDQLRLEVENYKAVAAEALKAAKNPNQNTPPVLIESSSAP